MHDTPRGPDHRVAQRVAQIIAEAQKPPPPPEVDMAAVRALAAMLLAVTPDDIRRALREGRRSTL